MAEPVYFDTSTPAEPAAWLDGTDPAGWTDTAGVVDPFPPPVDLDLPPVDPDLLAGTVESGEPPPIDPPEALRADLAAADGDPDADWAALHESDDPAVRALALRWQPDRPAPGPAA